jgi:hypothetical protein
MTGTYVHQMQHISQKRRVQYIKGFLLRKSRTYSSSKKDKYSLHEHISVHYTGCINTFFFMITGILWDLDENFLVVYFVNRKNVFDKGVQNVQETFRPVYQLLIVC